MTKNYCVSFTRENHYPKIPTKFKHSQYDLSGQRATTSLKMANNQSSIIFPNQIVPLPIIENVRTLANFTHPQTETHVIDLTNEEELNIYQNEPLNNEPLSNEPHSCPKIPQQLPMTNQGGQTKARTDMTIRNVHTLDDNTLVNLTNFMDSMHKQGASQQYHLYQELLNGFMKPGVVEALNAITTLAEAQIDTVTMFLCDLLLKANFPFRNPNHEKNTTELSFFLKLLFCHLRNNKKSLIKQRLIKFLQKMEPLQSE